MFQPQDHCPNYSKLLSPTERLVHVPQSFVSSSISEQHSFWPLYLKSVIPVISLFLFTLVFWDKIPSSTGWIWTHCSNDLEFLILCLHLPSAGVIGMFHPTCRIRDSAKHSANWATFPASRFSYMYLCFITSAFYHIVLLTPLYINPIRAGELIFFIHLTLSRAKNSAQDTVVFNIQPLFVQRAHTK